MIYVSAYYHIPKRSMPHMGISRYLRLAPVSLRMISGSQLVFFYEEDCIGEIVAKICEDWSVNLLLKKRPIGDLPQRRAALEIAANADRSALPAEDECVKEKGWSHLNGMVHGADRDEYEDNLAIWLSKVDLVQDASECAVSDDTPVAWMDFGIAKFNYMRSSWNFPVAVRQCDPSKLCHYDSSMRMCQRKLPLNASFLCGSPVIWAELLEEFQKQIAAAKCENYPHDEETLLAQIVKVRPELFQCIGHPFEGRLGKVRYLVERLRGQKF